MQVDFLFVSKRTDGSLGVSTVDPHGDHPADARPKLVALADYAERFGDYFVRIDSITKIGDELRFLDLTNSAVREGIRAFTGTKVEALYESEHATPYA